MSLQGTLHRKVHMVKEHSINVHLGVKKSDISHAWLELLGRVRI